MLQAYVPHLTAPSTGCCNSWDIRKMFQADSAEEPVLHLADSELASHWRTPAARWMDALLQHMGHKEFILANCFYINHHKPHWVASSQRDPGVTGLRRKCPAPSWSPRAAPTPWPHSYCNTSPAPLLLPKGCMAKETCSQSTARATAGEAIVRQRDACMGWIC